MTDPTPAPVTADTIVAVTMRGQRQAFAVGPPGPLAWWAHSLSDLTGYAYDHLLTTILDALKVRYGVEVYTAAGDLCPLHFLITKR